MRLSMLPFKRRTILYELLGLLVLYFLLSPIVASPLYEAMLFHPDRTYYSIAEEGCKKLVARFNVCREDCWIMSSDGKKIHAWYFKLPSSKRVFLVSHGNAGNICHRLGLINNLLSCGGSVLIYDYQGYGKSEGEPSRPNIVADGLAAYDYLVKNLNVNPGDIILYGESLGCAVSCQISKLHYVSAIILQSGWTSLLKAGRDRVALLWLYPDLFFTPPLLNNLEIVRRPHSPLLIIHGERDNILPCSYAKENYAKACEPKQIVLLPDASHNDVGFVDVELYLKGIRNFLESNHI